MKIVFLGTGEAFDENNPNNSSLVISGKANLLLDCGMTTPFQLWKYNNNPNFLDAVYISHSHADHYFGLPALLTRMWEEERKKPFTIICQNEESIKRLLEIGYSGIIKKLRFKIDFIKVKDNIKFRDLGLSFAKTRHSISNYAIKIENRGRVVCYSGDGDFTKDSERLYKDCDLLIHEAYFYNKKAMGHGCIVDLVKMAERNNVKCLALTHINRDVRDNLTKKKIYSKNIDIKVFNSFEKINI